MTTESIHLKALKFGDHESGGPTRVVADFPAEILYTLARIHGAIPHIVLTADAAQHSAEFYSFVIGRVVNRFYEDGVDEAVPGYGVFSREHVLAWHERDSNAARQELADQLEQTISIHFGEAETADTATERRELAGVLAQIVVNHGWRKVVTIGRGYGQ